jgi:DMSO/TMAO reductase YedYZ molybdopterin-dependent catalytic subunit
MMNAKWVESITVIGDDHRDYWAQRGWSEIGEVRNGFTTKAASRSRRERRSSSRQTTTAAQATLRCRTGSHSS